jgi:hypothetical protein
MIKFMIQLVGTDALVAAYILVQENWRSTVFSCQRTCFTKRGGEPISRESLTGGSLPDNLATMSNNQCC